MSLLKHGFVRTAAVERVVAPIGNHLCYLVLLCDNVEEPEQFSKLETAALGVAKAAENMAAVISRQIKESEDEVLHMEMSPLIESLGVSGQHVLLAAQKLGIQPDLPEHREELITATQSVFLGVVKVLSVDDSAIIRRVLAAVDRVSKSLTELGSSSDMSSLLRFFQGFSEALLILNKLTLERAKSLQDPGQTKRLLDCLETLKKCISMLHTAMCTTIKHPANEQAQTAKKYIMDKVQSTLGHIVALLSDSNREAVGPDGFYMAKCNKLLNLLNIFSLDSVQDSNFDSLVRDIVFHCMTVAHLSRRDYQQKIVSHCRLILQAWSDLKWTLKSSRDEADDSEHGFNKTSSLLVQQVEMLNKALVIAVLYQVLDIFVAADFTVDELLRMVKQILTSETNELKDLSFVQPVVEDLISSTDRVIQVVNFVSAVSVEPKTLISLENSKACLTRLRAQIAPLSLELADNSIQTIQKLHDICQKWEEEIDQLQDALTDAISVKEFTSLALTEMVVDRQGCDEAYREQSCGLFHEHGKSLICHMKLVMNAVRRHLNRSDNPIYRNGLLVLLKQAHSSQIKVAKSVSNMLHGSDLNVEEYSTFTDNVSASIQHFKVLREGLDGHQHPHLLSPLRVGARELETSASSPPDKELCRMSPAYAIRDSDSPVFCVMGKDPQTKHEDHDAFETIEPEQADEADMCDLKTTAVQGEPKVIHKPADFDFLPLLYEVVTVTKRKDVSRLNQECTRVLELSNCYAQAAKEGLANVDLVDSQTLESSRAELLSLTPLLVKTAQETAMSSALSSESIYRLSARFSDLIRSIRKILLPVAGTWYHAVNAELHGALLSGSQSVRQNLTEVMTLCAHVVQFLSSSDAILRGEVQEKLSVLNNKLRNVQNNTRCLVEFCTSPERQVDHSEGLCVQWGLSIQTLLNYLDKILCTSAAMNHLHPQKRLSTLAESSLRIQEATRLTGLNCKSAYKSKELKQKQDNLKMLTDSYLKAAEELGLMPRVIQLAKLEFLQRQLLIEIKVLSGRLSKENKEYNSVFENIVSIAEHSRDSNAEDTEQQFENAAQDLVENVKSATKRVEDSLHYIRDPRARSNLRSINEHLSFQISDIICRARLVVESQCICDTVSLDVQIQCWAAKAHYVAEEIWKQDAINQEAKERIKAGLKGRVIEEINQLWAKEAEIPQTNVQLWGRLTESQATTKLEPKTMQDDSATPQLNKEASLSYTSLFLKQKSDSWDPKDNKIVQVTRNMADTIYHMTQYLKKRGPILNKEAFVAAAKDVITRSETVTQFIRGIANHSLDKQCTVELSLITEQILTITNQLNIISSVNAVTPGCKSSDEILVKNAQNLLQTVLRGVHAAETACITGLKQPEPNSDGAEATALCFQWKRNLEIYRAQQSQNPETDELGLRKTLSHALAPSLAPKLDVQDRYK